MANSLGSCHLQALFHGALPPQNQSFVKKPGHLPLQETEMWTTGVLYNSLLAVTSSLGTALSSGLSQCLLGGDDSCIPCFTGLLGSKPH